MATQYNTKPVVAPAAGRPTGAIQGASKPVVILSDTDVDGLSGLVVALRTMRELGVPFVWYSHFATPQSTQPGTNVATIDLDSVLTYLMADPGAIYVFDIPPAVEATRRAKLMASIRNLRSIGVDVHYFDVTDHATPEVWRQLRDAGATLHLSPNGYELKISFAHSHGVFDEEVERWALVGSVADFDESVAQMTSKDLEFQVAMELDPVYKFALPKMVPQTDVQRFGSVGAVAKMIILDRNMGVADLLQMARELYQQLPQQNRIPTNISYRQTGFGVIFDTQQNKVPPGLVWKTAWYVAAVTDSFYAVAHNTPPPPGRQGVSIIVAAYWRKKSQVAHAIDQATQEIVASYGASVVGHSGARSILFPPGTDTEQIAYQLTRRIEELMSVSRVSHLVSSDVVAQAVQRDYQQILQKLTEILETQREMYKEYLELKRRQVELLEQTSSRDRARYD